MPRVPILEGSSVETHGLATPYSNLDTRGAFGGAAVDGLEQLAAGAQRVQGRLDAQREQEERLRQKSLAEARDFRLDEADLRLGKTINSLQHDKDTGFLNKQGEDALDFEPTVQEMERAREELGREFTDPAERQRFNLRAEARIEQSKVTLTKHSAGQRLNLYKSIAEGQMALAVEDARANPDGVDSAIEKVLVGPDGSPGPLRRYLLKLGLPTEKVHEQEREFRADTYAAALDKFVAAKDAKGAQAFLERVKPALGKKAASYEKVVGQLAQDTEAERVSAMAVELARDQVTGRVDSAQALSTVDSVPEGALRDEVRQRLEHRVLLADREWKTTVDTRYDRALAAYLQGGSLSAVDSRDKAWLIQNAPEEWDKLRGKARRDADYSRAREKEHRGGETDEQREALLELRADLVERRDVYDSMSPAEFNSAWAHRLSPSGYKTAGALFADTKKDKPESAAEFSRFVSDEVRGNELLKDKKQADMFRALMGDARRAFKEKNKREPTLEELEELRTSVWRTKKSGMLWWAKDQPTLKTREEVRPSQTPDSDDLVAPLPPRAARPSKQDRMRELIRQGRNNADIKKTLSDEGY